MFKKSQRGFKKSPFTFFDTIRLFQIFIFIFFRNEFNVSKGPPSFFLRFRIKLDFQKPKDPHCNFRHRENFPIFLKKLAFFPRDFFPICFYRHPLSIFTRNERFCEHRGFLRVFGSMRLTGDFILKISEKVSDFFLNFYFFNVLLSPVGEKEVFEFSAYPLRYILAL